jgi:glycosyltransferase involved in cell wall biosynthesis
MVSNGLVRGGAETQQVRLALELQRRGHKVRFLTILPTKAFSERLAEAGIEVDTLCAVDEPSLNRAPAVVLAARRALRRWKPDVVISFVYQANLLGRIAGKAAGVPAVISSVRNETFGGSARDRSFKLTDSLSGATTSNSAVTAERLLRDNLVPPEKLHVVPNAIDLAELAPDPVARAEVRRELGVSDESFLWVAIGRLRPQKDFSLLISAIAGTEPTVGGAVIAGVGPMESELKAEIRSHAVADRVRLLGLRDDVPRLLQAADALALSSAWEGLPNVVMEAMAAQLPVVATDVGGVRELVTDSVSGRVVPKGDAAAFSDAMTWVASKSAEERAEMGRVGHETIAARFGVSAIVDHWERLAEELLAAKGKS